MDMFVGSFDRLKDSLGQRQTQFKRLLDECRREMEGPHYDTHPAMSITFMALYMINQAVAYKMTDDKRYLEEAIRWMDTVESFEHWGNDAKMEDVDLSASWVLFGLSIASSWLEPYLSSEQRERYERKIVHHASIFHRYWKSTYGKGWATEYWQNHNWINMTGLAAAGYRMKGKVDAADIWIKDTEANFREVYKYMADDGSNYEGVSYWRYGGMWLFVYAYLYRAETGFDYFSSSEYLKNTFYYRLYQSSPDLATQLNFGDAHDRYSCHCACVYYLVAAEYRDGYAQKFGNLASGRFLKDEAEKSGVHPGILPEAGLEFIWYDPSVEERAFDDLPLSRFFPDLGLYTVRSDWSDSAKVFSFKCGYPGGKKQWTNGWRLNRANGWRCMSLSHHHPDNLSYILCNGKKYFTCEDGYDRNLMAYCHNAILADGRTIDVEGASDAYLSSVYSRFDSDPSFLPDREYVGNMNVVAESRDFILLEGESSGTYAADLGIKKASRLVFTVPSLDFIVFADETESDKEHSWTVLCNTDEKPVRDGSAFVYRDSGVRYSVIASDDVSCNESVHEVRSIMTPQEPDKFTHVEINSLESTIGKASHSMKCLEFLDLSDGVWSVKQSETGFSVIKDEENVFELSFHDGMVFVKAPSGYFAIRR